jgi:hypothetical protein
MYNELVSLRKIRESMPALLRSIEFVGDPDLDQFLEELEKLVAYLPQIKAEKSKRRSALPYAGFGEFEDEGTPQLVLLERAHEAQTRR